jgi:serine/threonine protein kinase/WD40 repeat protein
MSANSPELKSIFGRALEIESTAARAQYLDAACADNATLRDELDSLLAAAAKAGSFMRDAAIGPAVDPNVFGATMIKAEEPESPGSMIGPYKLLQQIGEGGFGVVYLAEQVEPVRRKVALKVIKPGMDSRQIIARFEAERQALALMDHQNIARVLDAGTTGQGRPYFVMELVKGVPITEYCDQNKLTPRERLELFIPVCQAIQHAHQKGIIHRDIKPSNVLVCLYDGRPVAKVIDFGVAKAIEQRLTEKTMFTQHGQVIGTLEYMSPEQAELSQLDIDTRSDIYSLGVLLYELLTGTTPITKEQLREGGFIEMLRMIRETEPDRPSFRLSHSQATLVTLSAQRRTEPAKLGALLQGELDWLVMKALEKDRTRRYETATALARDIERYLNDEPVEACPPSTFYRIRKFVRRRRRSVIFGGLIAFLLLDLLVVHFVNYYRLQESQTQTSREAKRALAAETLAVDRLSDVDRQRQRAEDAEQVARVDRDRALEAEKLARIDRDRAVGAEKEAVRQRGLETRAREQALDALARGKFDQAHSVRLTSQTGRRWQSLDLLKRAESLRARAREKVDVEGGAAVQKLDHDLPFVQLPSQIELRTEAVASLLFDDARPVRKWEGLIHAVSPDGKFVATASLDLANQQGLLTVNDVLSGKEITKWGGKQFLNFVGGTVALGPGGTQLAGLSQDLKSVELFDLVKQAKIATLTPPQSIVEEQGEGPPKIGAASLTMHLSFSPDGHWLAGVHHPTLKSDPAVLLWNLREPGPARSLERLKLGTMSFPVFSPDSRHLAFIGNSNKLTIWSTTDSRVAAEVEKLGAMSARLCFIPGGDLIAVHSMTPDSGILLWNYATGQEEGWCETDSLMPVAPLRCAPDGSRLATSGPDGKLMVIEMAHFSKGKRPDSSESIKKRMARQATGVKLKSHFQLDQGRMTDHLDWSSDSHQLLSGGLGALTLWEVANADSLATLQLEQSIPARMALSPDGRAIALERGDRPEITILDRSTGNKIRGWNERVKANEAVCGFQFSADGKQIVQCGRGGLVAWNVETGEKQFDFTTTDREVIQSVGFASDGRVLAGGALQLKPTVWDALTGKVVWQTPQTHPTSTVEISPNGRFGIVYESYGPGPGLPASLVDALTGQQQFQFPITGKESKSINAHQWQISSDNRWIQAIHAPGPAGGVSASVQQGLGTRRSTITQADEPWTGDIWNAETHKLQAQIHGSSRVLCSTFSPDGRIFAAIMVNGIIRLWSVETGNELFDWLDPTSSTDKSRFAPALAFTADSSTLAVSDSTTSVLYLLDLKILNRSLAEVSLGW